jgi:hypothetical protein
MTFGYSSQLIDRGNNSGMTEWVHDLLTAVSNERRSEKVSVHSHPFSVSANSTGKEAAHYLCLSFYGWHSSTPGKLILPTGGGCKIYFSNGGS